MTHNEELLFKDLSAKLPYGVKVEIDGLDGIHEMDSINIIIDQNGCKCAEVKVAKYNVYYPIIKVKPYLRDFEDMTESEFDEHEKYVFPIFDMASSESIPAGTLVDDAHKVTEFYDSHLFDTRSLLKLKLAKKAEEGFYDFK